MDPPHPRGVKRAYVCGDVCGWLVVWLVGCVVLWQLYTATLHLLISGHECRTAPKFGTHVRIDILTLKKKFDPPHPGGGLGGYILLKIFRDGSRPNLARMCG